MIRLLPDVNVVGHVAIVLARMQGDYWRDLWEHLAIRSLTFQDVGLSPDAADSHVWQLCQQHQLHLLTNNRNDDGPDSLEATIRLHCTGTTLPVFTFSDADRIYRSPVYAERVTESLFDHLLRIDTLRGTGRLYLP